MDLIYFVCGALVFCAGMWVESRRTPGERQQPKQTGVYRKKYGNAFGLLGPVKPKGGGDGR